MSWTSSASLVRLSRGPANISLREESKKYCTRCHEQHTSSLPKSSLICHSGRSPVSISILAQIYLRPRIHQMELLHRAWEPRALSNASKVARDPYESIPVDDLLAA